MYNRLDIWCIISARKTYEVHLNKKSAILSIYSIAEWHNISIYYYYFSLNSKSHDIW